MSENGMNSTSEEQQQQQPTVCETGHEDVVHDTQWDFYGRFMATCSSDRTVRVFATSTTQGEKPRQVATLTGHEGPVWMVNWAHPKYGNVLASCSYDHKSIIWKEGTGGQWKPIHIVSNHKGSVNSLNFSPNEYGLNLATASSDGTVAVTSFADGNWRESVTIGNGDRAAHPLGAMSVSFAPYHPNRTQQPMLASGGCDAAVRVWTQGGSGSGWTETVSFSDHKDWVRDVAFNQDASSKFTVLASCSQDKTVVIRRINLEEAGGAAAAADAKNWEVSVTTFPETCWRLSWSPCGTMLLVTTGDSQAFLLKQGASFTDEWIRMPIEQ